MADTLAVNGGTPVRTQPWPKWPVFDERDERALLEALRSGVWGIGGKRVGEFECAYAGLHEARFGVACCNGTVALQIALVAAGVQPGDEVITTPYTFMASALAIAAVGAVPVFVDVEEGTHNIDPRLIEAAVSDRTTAIMPVHIGGRPCDMDAIMDIAQRRGLKVVEDAAQGWMGAWRGTPVGAIGAAGTFSFQSSKNLNCGEGGIILTNDEGVYQRAWSYHNCGRTLGGAWYQHDYPGFNYRLTELQAALLQTQMARLPEQQARRREAMAALDAGLAAVPGLKIAPADPRITGHAAHIYMVRLDPATLGANAALRQAFMKALQAEGVPVGPGYTTPLYKQKFWQWFDERPTGGGGTFGDTVRFKFDAYDLPVCQRLCDTTLWVKQDVLAAGAAEMKDVVAAFAKVADAARAGRLA